MRDPERRRDGAGGVQPRPPVALAFGPIPSRRLGRSLGINNIPPKVCSYACVYCQVGSTPAPQIEPRPIYPPEQVAQAVTEQVRRARSRGESIDHLTFVPDGEPTLDANLGRTIELLRPLQIPIAIISNGSLAWRADVRAALRAADLVSVKVDATDEDLWRSVDRPPEALRLRTVLDGLRALAERPPSVLVTETMLVEGMNDGLRAVSGVATFLEEIAPTIAYLAIPTRPPAVPGVRGPDESVLAHAYHVLAQHVARVEYLVGYEGDAFAATGDPRADLLAITAVHPMRESAVRDLLRRSASGWDVVEELVGRGRLCPVDHAGERFYVRRVPRRDAPQRT